MTQNLLHAKGLQPLQGQPELRYELVQLPGIISERVVRRVNVRRLTCFGFALIFLRIFCGSFSIFVDFLVEKSSTR